MLKKEGEKREGGGQEETAICRCPYTKKYIQTYITHIHENGNESVEGNLSPKSETKEDVEVL